MTEEYIEALKHLAKVLKGDVLKAHMDCINLQLNEKCSQQELIQVLWQDPETRSCSKSIGKFIYRICLPRYKRVLDAYSNGSICLEVAMNRVREEKSALNKEQMYRRALIRLVRFARERMRLTQTRLLRDVRETWST